MVVKRMVVQRLIRWFSLAACFLSAPCLPAVARASPAPSDSVLHCVVLDPEAWMRENPAPAGKAAADKNAGEPRTVRMVYFVPKDRPYRQAVVDSMKTTMRQMHAFFGQQMAAHGYGEMTFRYETDAEGAPLVHRVDGEHGDAYYLEETLNRSWEEIFGEYVRHYHVYLIVIDNSTGYLYIGRSDRWRGAAVGGRQRGVATVTAEFYFGLVRHELAHAFGMGWHDFRDDTYVLSYTIGSRKRLSACAAGYLSVMPWFNPEITQEYDWSSRPTVEVITPTRWYPAGTTHVTIPIKVTDPDGVHQVFLFPNRPLNRTLTPELKACRMLAGETETIVAFEYDGVIPNYRNSSFSDPPSHIFAVSAADKNGYWGGTYYGIAQRSPYHLATLKAPSSDAFYRDLAFSPDGTTLASASNGGTVRLWDVASREQIATLAHSIPVRSVAFSPDGGILAVGSNYGRITLWDVASREEVATLEGHERHEVRGHSVWSVVFSPDGDLLASGSTNGTVILWDVASRAEIATLEGHTEEVHSVAFSPDGTTLASASSDGTVKLWDVAPREETATLEGHWYSVGSVAFSPDGTILASGSTDGTVRLWEVASRQHLTTLRARARVVWRVAFSPDGAVLAANSGKGRIDLWDVTSEKLVETFPQPGSINSMALSPDGGVLAAASSSGVTVIELWDTASFMSPQSRVPDFDGDGVVGFSDFVKFTAKYGFSRGQIGYDPRFDLDRDGNVGFGDFLIFANAFGQTA